MKFDATRVREKKGAQIKIIVFLFFISHGDKEHPGEEIGHGAV